MEQLMSRYTPAQRSVIEAYWETVRFTRSTGKISDGIKRREMEYWAKYDPSLVIRALSIHIQKYPNIKENYTRGILRNLKGGASHAGDARNHVRHHGTAASGAGKRDSSAEEAFRRRLTGSSL
ncbi:hypothetical protein RI662_03605 [Brevibacillus agri]|uniref:hypothetical protein n=1 Tax=Brevibacillus agri TaxID=51101 RepID=UPI00287054D3|nr:hypothetical protein [Brevibacillus agri]MDR9503387.1 hypothetical protein [Brevibacillus agri]